MRIKPDALYLCDNGALYCGAHLGATAKATGHDISGQKIEEVTPDGAREFSALGLVPKCEIPSCGKVASALYLVGA